MKKKYLNIVLVIVLIFVWGSIIRKYFGNKGSKDNIVEIPTAIGNYNYDDKKSKDTFKLKLTNTNPFKTTKRRLKKITTTSNNVPKSNTVKKKESKPVVWPKMTYHGFVKSNDKTTKLVILKVNDKLYRKREKEKIDQLLVVKAYEDSLILLNNNESKTIKRKDETL